MNSLDYFKSERKKTKESRKVEFINKKGRYYLKGKRNELCSFENMDNLVLQRLCGTLDEHLQLLGKALSVQVSRRFTDFTFFGDGAHAARQALLMLAKVAQTRDLLPEDIQLPLGDFD